MDVHSIFLHVREPVTASHYLQLHDKVRFASLEWFQRKVTRKLQPVSGGPAAQERLEFLKRVSSQSKCSLGTRYGLPVKIGEVSHVGESGME